MAEPGAGWLRPPPVPTPAAWLSPAPAHARGGRLTQPGPLVSI